MAPFQKNITDIQAKLQGIIGQKAWGVEHGMGTFVTIEFGEPQPPEYPRGKAHGEWYLWVYGGAWRLEKGEQILTASEDDPTKIEAEIQCVEGCILQSFEVVTPRLLMLFSPLNMRLPSVFLVSILKKLKSEGWIVGGFLHQMQER